MGNRRFYTFRAGQDVPRWMMGVVMNDGGKPPKALKITFLVSCMVMHTKGCLAAIMPVGNKSVDGCLILVSGASNLTTGGIGGATGTFMMSDDRMHEMHRLYSEHELEMSHPASQSIQFINQ